MFDNLVESSAKHDDSARKGWFFLGTFALYGAIFLALLVIAIDQYDRSLTAQNLADLKIIANVVTDEPPAPEQQKKEEQPKQTAVKVEQQVATVREITSIRPETVAVGTRASTSPPVPGAVKGKV